MVTTRICSIPDCGKPFLARGWCSKHYSRWRATGSPTAPLARSARGEPMRFYEALFETTRDDCVFWPFASDGGGYGTMWDGEKVRKVHPMVCARVHGPRPTPTSVARHLCGKGHLGCVNPRHLVWGTMKENSADSLLHGTRDRGEDKKRARFTNAQILEIRELNERRYEKGLMVKDIAKMFGCDPRRITEITKNRVYAHTHAGAIFMTKTETVMPDGITHVVDPDVKPIFANVYQTLRAFVLEHGGHRPSTKWLAELSGCSSGSVRKAACILTAKGYATMRGEQWDTLLPTDLNRTLSHC